MAGTCFHCEPPPPHTHQTALLHSQSFESWVLAVKQINLSGRVACFSSNSVVDAAFLPVCVSPFLVNDTLMAFTLSWYGAWLIWHQENEENESIYKYISSSGSIGPSGSKDLNILICFNASADLLLDSWNAFCEWITIGNRSVFVISLQSEVTLSMSINLPDKLTLQICPLLCLSLAEVQGTSLIFMEIRDNIHQLSFTSFIFISFSHINSIRPSSAVSKIWRSVLDCWDPWKAQISAARTSSNTHAQDMRGEQTLSDPLGPAWDFLRDSHICSFKKMWIFCCPQPSLPWNTFPTQTAGKTAYSPKIRTLRCSCCCMLRKVSKSEENLSLTLLFLYSNAMYVCNDVM